ncbi:MAG: SAF domain-containing protein [Archangium sp.]
MTPLNPQAPRSSGSGFIGGLAVGLGLFFVALCIGGAVGFSYVQKQRVDVRKGWNLVPVIVAAVDISEGSEVKMEMISQRSIPEQFVTSSIVKPDSASYIVNQKVLVAVQAGDPLRWSDFETVKKPKVLFAARDVALGAALSSEDMVEGTVDEKLKTDSWVAVPDGPTALGRKLIAPFRKGDPILWTHLQAPGAK